MSVDPMGGWVQIYLDDYGHRSGQVESFVRAWTPGDGLECRVGGGRKSHKCSKPVAVHVQRENEDYTAERKANGYRWSAKPPRTRTLCAIHLTSLFAKSFGVDVKAAEQAAQQEICARYRRQYEIARDKKIEAMKEDRLNELPAAVRNLLAEQIEDGTIWDFREGNGDD